MTAKEPTQIVYGPMKSVWMTTGQDADAGVAKGKRKPGAGYLERTTGHGCGGVVAWYFQNNCECMGFLNNGDYQRGRGIPWLGMNKQEKPDIKSWHYLHEECMKSAPVDNYGQGDCGGAALPMNILQNFPG